MSALTIRALCSGYGGLETAVEQVTGGTVVDHAEIDPAASKVHEAHWPGIPNLGDITANCVEFTHRGEVYTTLNWAALERTDVLCAGFPCQPISQAGRRKVTNDARWLWPHIAHAVRVLRPRLVCVENVPPLLRPWRDDDEWWNPAPIEEVAGDLAEAGYDTRWTCLRASDVGAPHRRERVFIAAVHAHHLGREGSQPRPFGDAGRGRGPAANAVRAGAGRDGRAVPRAQGPRLGLRAPVDARAAATDPDGEPRRWARDTERGDGPATHVRRGAPQPGGRRGATADAERGGRQAGPRVDVLCPDWVVSPGADADGLGVRDWGVYGRAIARWERILGRAAPTPVDHLGRLAPEFSEWMMGLPAGWVTDIDISRTAQLHVIGNGVVTQAAVAALVDLLEPWEMAA